MKKITAFVMCLAFILSAGMIWGEEAATEGTAAMSPQGMFPERGYYGASDSFSIGSIVNVSNKSNNKSIEVYIVEKSEDSFLLLSFDAAMRLGIKKKDTAEVTVSLVRAGSSSQPDKAKEIDSLGKGVTKKKYTILPEGVERQPEPLPEPEPQPVPEPAAPAEIAEEEAEVQEDEAPVTGNIVELVIVPEGGNSMVGEDTRGKVLPFFDGFFYVQLGNFSDAGNAENLAYKLDGSDEPIIVVRTQNGAFTGYKVFAGPVPLADKTDILAEYVAAGYPDAFAKINE